MTFDSAERGTSAEAWRRSETLRSARAAQDADFAALVVVVAHPDDETLMAGGLIARFGRSGRRVMIVIASDGEASHPDSPTHSPERLASIRAGEAREAVAHLAPDAELVRLGLPDGALADHVDDIATAVRERLGPDVLLVSTWDGDGHPDHAAIARATAVVAAPAGVAHWQAPVWLWHWGDPNDDAALPVLHRIALTPGERAAKTAASRSYPSQTEPLSEHVGDEALLAADTLKHFAGDAEFFVTGTGSATATGFASASASEVGSVTALATASASAARGERLNVDFFDDFYAGGRDPWGFETRWYEQRKRDLLLAVLPRPRAASALELGCSIGVTTAALAGRCDELLALDIAERPLVVARERLAAAPGVRFERRDLPEEWPEGVFDLIVMSEVGYYLDAAGLRDLIRRMVGALGSDGVLVACHWRHPVGEYPLSGDAVHAALAEAGLPRTVRHVEADFLLDVFQVDGRSVAAREGLL